MFINVLSLPLEIGLKIQKEEKKIKGSKESVLEYFFKVKRVFKLFLFS